MGNGEEKDSKCRVRSGTDWSNGTAGCPSGQRALPAWAGTPQRIARGGPVPEEVRTTDAESLRRDSTRRDRRMDRNWNLAGAGRQNDASVTTLPVVVMFDEIDECHLDCCNERGLDWEQRQPTINSKRLECRVVPAGSLEGFRHPIERGSTFVVIPFIPPRGARRHPRAHRRAATPPHRRLTCPRAAGTENCT